MYLMIRNPGVADWRGFTLIGASTTRNADLQGTIGQFGSGSKLSVALFLRMGIRPIVVPDTQKMEFFTKPEIIGGQTFNRVCVEYTGKKNTTEDLGFTLEWGAADWNDLSMALREFVSNAIDGSIAAGKSHKDVEFAIVPKARGKTGYTSVYIPYTAEVERVYSKLGTMFLHVGNPDLLNKKILPKQTDDKIYIYKNGVLVCEIDQEKSVYNYNLGNELKLDESRNASTWDVRMAVAETLKNASASELTPILKSAAKDEKTLESTLDYYSLSSTYASLDAKERRMKEFKSAWNAVAGENGVATSGNVSLDSFVKNKGFVPVAMPKNWIQILESYGIPSETKVLNRSEQEGKTISPATDDMMDAVDWVWDLLLKYKFTNNRAKPHVRGFRSLMDGGSQVLGYYDNDVVYLHADDLAGKLLKKAALEEVIHHVTGSKDGSRDLQDALFRLILEMALTDNSPKVPSNGVVSWLN